MINKQIHSIEQTIEEFVKLHSSCKVFIVLNKTALQDECKHSINSVCLHLATKYNCLQWPKLCISESKDIVLFIGVVD